jgi:hypothetical protein
MLLMPTAVAAAPDVTCSAGWRQEAACTCGQQGQGSRIAWQSQLLLLFSVLVQQCTMHSPFFDSKH